MARIVFLVLLALGHSTTATSDRSVAAVQKVIQMLQDMSAKAKDEKNKEEVAFAEFQTWCKMEIPQTKKAIAKGAETIELLQAEIAKLTTEIKVLGEEIEKLTADV